MVKHVVMWDLPEGLAPTEKERIATLIKTELEGLVGRVPGLLEVKVHAVLLASSNAELILESLHQDQDALLGYSEHPEHLKVANGTVRPNTRNRRCADFVVEDRS